MVDPWAAAEQAGPRPVAEPESREGYGSTAYLSRRYGSSAGANHSTVVPPSPDGGEALPIFDAIESNWFRRRSGGPTAAEPETGPMPRMGAAAGTGAPAPAPAATPQVAPEPSTRESAAPEPQPEDEWRSDADRGWKAARSAAEPIAGGLTSSGLPKRVPKANLVPGTVPQPENVRQIPARSADRVRSGSQACSGVSAKGASGAPANSRTRRSEHVSSATAAGQRPACRVRARAPGTRGGRRSRMGHELASSALPGHTFPIKSLSKNTWLTGGPCLGGPREGRDGQESR